ncbi:hypothetical protein D6Z88_003482 [Escherichia coli]|nr:hypothetical protein [Escherichia coli]NPO08184.1 hypothetical protein [Escherichia coli]
MSQPTKKINNMPEWLRPVRKLTKAERQEMRNAIRGYVVRRKAEGAAQ